MHAQPDTRSAGDLVYSRAPAARPSPQKLVETHLGLVRKIAWHVHGHVSSAIEVGDLVQIGTVALLEAARNFEERGVAAFSSYATTRIRGAMIDQLRRQANMCRSALVRRRRLNAARKEAEVVLGRSPTQVELAARMGISVEELLREIDATQGVQYENLDDIYSDHSEWFVDDGETPADALERADLERALAAGIRNLPEREAMVLQLYYVEELNLDEIGEVLGVGAARVCQIKKVALDRMRGQLSEWTE